MQIGFLRTIKEYGKTNKMSLDTYGFIADCQCCVDHGLSKMDNPPLSPEGVAEARESFGDLWPKYKKNYLFSAKYYNGRDSKRGSI
jgi:hypothetical protein